MVQDHGCEDLSNAVIHVDEIFVITEFTIESDILLIKQVDIVLLNPNTNTVESQTLVMRNNMLFKKRTVIKNLYLN